MSTIFMLLYTALVTVIAEEIYIEELGTRDSRRGARSAPQDHLMLNLKRNSGEDVSLNLRENKAINVNAPVYEGILENGIYRTVLKRSPNIEDVRYYYDSDKKAALQVSCAETPGGKCFRQIEGVVDIDGELYDVKPKKTTLVARYSGGLNSLPHLLQRSKEADLNLNDGTLDIKRSTLFQRNSHILQQRQEHTIYTVEMIIALDPPLWNLFVLRTNNKYGTTDDAEVEKEARRYYATVIHLASMAYEGINHPEFTIKIVISGFLFFKTQTPKMIEANVYTTDGYHTEGVHFGEFLSAMYKEMRENGVLQNVDHVYTFTSTGAQGVAGADCLGCVCETRGWGWSTSEGNELSYETRLFVHELGHGLGLYHLHVDNYPDLTCDPEEGYVMGSYVPGRYWKFSECSIRELKVYLAETGHTCLLNNPHIYNNEEWNEYTSRLPGEIRSITEQCIDVNNGQTFRNEDKESALCNDVTDPDFCYDMGCISGSGCTYLVAADGTTCGLPSANKWCMAAKCVSKPGDSVTPETTGDAENCYNTWAETYLGTRSVSMSGTPCQRWDSNYPHSHSHNIDEKFLDSSAASAANYCRDPTARGTPWCFLKDRWDYCDVPQCSTERDSQCTSENWEYQKTLTVTKSGIPCQRWDSQTPHSHRFTTTDGFPDETLADAGNFCRNPDNEPSPWCYTSDENTRWEYCEMKKCKDDTCYSSLVEYTGSVSHTKRGIPCQAWDSSSPNTNNYKGQAEGNACRSLDTEVPWCYLGKSWEYCDIPRCS